MVWPLPALLALTPSFLVFQVTFVNQTIRTFAISLNSLFSLSLEQVWLILLCQRASNCPSRSTFNLSALPCAPGGWSAWARFSGFQLGLTGDEREGGEWGQSVYSLGSFLSGQWELAGPLYGRSSSLKENDCKTCTPHILGTADSSHLMGSGWDQPSTTYKHSSFSFPYTLPFGNKSSFSGPILNVAFVSC